MQERNSGGTFGMSANDPEMRNRLALRAKLIEVLDTGPNESRPMVDFHWSRDVCIQKPEWSRDILAARGLSNFGETSEHG